MSEVFDFLEESEYVGRVGPQSVSECSISKDNISQWWMEAEEGSYIFRMADSEFDECLIVRLGKASVLGSVVVHLATAEGPKSLELPLKNFKVDANEDCMTFATTLWTRTLFLKRFVQLSARGTSNPGASNTKSNAVVKTYSRPKTTATAGTQPSTSKQGAPNTTSNAHVRTYSRSKTVPLPATAGTQPSTSKQGASNTKSNAVVRTYSRPKTVPPPATAGTQPSMSKQVGGPGSLDPIPSTYMESDLRPATATTPSGTKGSTPKEAPTGDCTPSMTAMHKVAESIKIKLELLKAPSPERRVRQLDSTHTLALQERMHANPDASFMKFLVHIPGTSASAVDQAEVNRGGYHLEVLGGNHSRVALQALYAEDRPLYIDAVLYAGLSTRQALCLALQHNQTHTSAKPMKFAEYVVMFRKIWVEVCSDLSSPPKRDRTHFKEELADNLRVSKQQVCNSYRHHMFFARLQPSVWEVFQRFIHLWEKRKITGQPDKDLTQWNVIPLEKEECLTEVLRGLCEGIKTWDEVRSPSRNVKKPDNGSLERQVGALKRKNLKLEATEAKMKADISSLKRRNKELEEELADQKRKASTSEVTKVCSETPVEQTFRETLMMEETDVTKVCSEPPVEQTFRETLMMEETDVTKVCSEPPVEQTSQETLMMEETDEDTLNAPMNEDMAEDITTLIRPGEWVAVMFSKTFYVGQIKSVLEDDRLRIVFLSLRCKGRLNHKDIQDVERKFIVTNIPKIICTDNVYSLPPVECDRINTCFDAYKAKYM